jgi:hypothetical protein
MERVQCISARQASITALLDISDRAQVSMQMYMAKNQPGRAENEYRKISVSLTKVRQFSAEVESCMQADRSGANNQTNIEIDNTAVSDLILEDERNFGRNTVETAVKDLGSEVEAGVDEDLSSDSASVPPPPSSSPFE